MAKEKGQRPDVGDQISEKTNGKKLLDEACKAFGIAPEYLFNSRVDGDEVVLVTNGGKKVRYKSGDKVEALDSIAVTGINPAAAKRKVFAGKPKK